MFQRNILVSSSGLNEYVEDLVRLHMQVARKVVTRVHGRGGEEMEQ